MKMGAQIANPHRKTTSRHRKTIPRPDSGIGKSFSGVDLYPPFHFQITVEPPRLIFFLISGGSALLIREHHQRKLTELASINTRDKLSDQLTKTNTGPPVRRLRDWMLRGVVPTDADRNQLSLSFRAG